MNIRHILILPLCLALAPCCTQEEQEQADAPAIQTGITSPKEWSDEELVEGMLDIFKPVIENTEKVYSLLTGIKDKASADAAAFELARCILVEDEVDGKLEESGMMEEVSRRGIELVDIMASRFPEALELEKKCKALRQSLAKLDPPYYASRLLENCFNGGASLTGQEREEFQKLHSALGELAEAVGKLENEAEVKAFAKGRAAWLSETMIRLLGYYDHLKTSTAPEAAQQREAIKSSVQILADTQRPEELVRFLWGWKQVAGLLEKPAEYELFANCFYDHAHAMSAPADLEEILSTVNDRGTADIASTAVHELVCALRGPDGSGRLPEYAPVPEGFKAWMTYIFGTPEEAEARVRQLFTTMEGEDCYGSDMLKYAIQELDLPTAPVEEQSRRIIALAGAVSAAAREQAEVLRGIKDKETADAAALRIEEIGDALQTKMDEYSLWRRSIYAHTSVMPGVDGVSEKYRADVQDMLEVTRDLAGQDPPFYGSTALQEACRYDESGDDDDDEEEEEDAADEEE